MPRQKANTYLPKDFPPAGFELVVNGTQLYKATKRGTLVSEEGRAYEVLYWASKCPVCDKRFVTRTAKGQWPGTRRCLEHRAARPVTKGEATGPFERRIAINRSKQTARQQRRAELLQQGAKELIKETADAAGVGSLPALTPYERVVSKLVCDDTEEVLRELGYDLL